MGMDINPYMVSKKKAMNECKKKGAKRYKEQESYISQSYKSG